MKNDLTDLQISYIAKSSVFSLFLVKVADSASSHEGIKWIYNIRKIIKYI